MPNLVKTLKVEVGFYGGAKSLVSSYATGTENYPAEDKVKKLPYFKTQLQVGVLIS